MRWSLVISCVTTYVTAAYCSKHHRFDRPLDLSRYSPQILSLQNETLKTIDIDHANLGRGSFGRYELVHIWIETKEHSSPRWYIVDNVVRGIIPI